MWRFRSLSLLLLIGLVSCSAPMSAQTRPEPGFSADFVITDPGNSFGGNTAGRLYLDEPGMRIENDFGAEVAVTILDFANNNVIWLDHEDRSYSESARLGGELGIMESLLASDDGLCGEDEDSNVEAVTLGIETLDGREVEKWRCTYASSGASATTWTLWHDSLLPIPIRIEVNTGYMFVLRNIVVAQQPAVLFRVPAGYTKRADSQGPTIRVILPD